MRSAAVRFGDPRKLLCRVFAFAFLLGAGRAIAQEGAGLEKAQSRAVALLKEHAGIAFDPAPEFRVVQKDELRAAIRREQELLHKRFLAPDQIKEMTGKLVDVLASQFLGKYAIEDKVILVSKANVERTFREASLEGKEREDLLLYVLLHELVHAWQDRKYGLFGRLETVRTAEDLMVFNAMMEGHAEFVSRRVSAKAGFSEKVQAMGVRSAAGMPVESAQEAMEAAAQEMFDLCYVRGRKFFEHLEAKGGGAAVESALRERWPADSSVLLRPERFFEKEAPGGSGLDLEWILKGAEGLLGGWEISKGVVGEAQARVGFSAYGFPKQKVDAALAGYIEGRTWMCRSGAKDLTLVAVRFRGEKELQAYKSLGREGNRILVENKIVTGFREAEIDLGAGRKGKATRLTMAFGGQAIASYSVEFAKGAVEVGIHTVSEKAVGDLPERVLEKLAERMEKKP